MPIIAQQHLRSAQAFSLSPSAPLVRRLGVHQQLGGDTAGRAELRDIPYCMALCSAIKAGERKNGETSGFTAFVFLSNHHTWHSPAFPEMAEQLPTNQKEQTNSLFCFACAHSFWLHQSAFITTHKFAHFYSSDSARSTGRSDRAAVWGWAAYRG